MCTINAPHRHDVVGSFLRPERLKKARNDFEKGKIDREELTKIENEEIKKIVDKQIELGYTSVTDGEFRRSYWHLDFFWGFNGIEHIHADKGYEFNGVVTRDDTAIVTGKISGENHPFVKHFIFLRDLVKDKKGVEARFTIPAPAQFYAELVREDKHVAALLKVYPDFKGLEDDIVNAYKTVINDLYNEGLRTLQIDDCTWGCLVDDDFIASFIEKSDRDKEIIRQEFAERFLNINNRVFQNNPEDLVINTHVCRGNYASTWFGKGGYDKIADELFGKEDVNAYYLEFDTERAGTFESLAKVSGDKKVVLGLITSKNPTLEEKESVIARIKEASKYVPLDRLYLSPQCGFASTEEGNRLTEEEQWAKLRFIKEIADEVWGEN